MVVPCTESRYGPLYRGTLVSYCCGRGAWSRSRFYFDLPLSFTFSTSFFLLFTGQAPWMINAGFILMIPFAHVGTISDSHYLDSLWNRKSSVVYASQAIVQIRSTSQCRICGDHTLLPNVSERSNV
ncbi:uncharacterized protein BDW43DRAFT_229024 [Aspergillus alliaceus]|uniref:uncharacterized protein n=1 Tax=Petromyces alliaceus TaxID=209559 RepID=UPI0012A58008|nr:uncharacterized protein BDW43DRAFT_229024 [Aspergillus alliaceus]KAB8237026.1 hypothetical protein BDW43DRAFT_229024 [Aspergillus alliaceus]